MRNGCRRHRFAVDSYSICARVGTEGCRCVFSFLVMLCYCFFHVFRYFVQWNWCIKAMCSTVVCCNSIVLCNSVCADRSGMAASRLLEAYLFSSTVLRFWLWFASPWRKSYCSNCEKVATGALAASFLHFGADDFPFNFFSKRASKSSFFRLGVEIRFGSCNLCSRCAWFYCVVHLSLRRSQWMAASRFLAATAACVILVCFAAERCHGSMKVANGAW